MSKITVFMPVFNGERFIGEAIESVLAQSFKEFEFLIIDDGSIDNSIEVIESYKDQRIKLVKNNKNMGLPYTRNKGINLAKGKYITLIDCDDICKVHRLKKQFEFMEENADIDILGSAYDIIDENGKYIMTENSYQNSKFIEKMLIFNNCVGNSTIMIRKDFIIKNNIKYDNRCFIAQDYKFLIEASKVGKISCLRDSLVRYRTGHNNITKTSNTYRLQERKEVITYIRKFVLEQNGYILDNSEFEIINEVFCENGRIKEREQIKKLYNIFKGMLEKTRAMGKDTKEISEVIRLKFGDKIRGCNIIWDMG